MRMCEWRVCFVLQTQHLQAGEFNLGVDRLIITSSLREVQAELYKILKYGSLLTGNQFTALNTPYLAVWFKRFLIKVNM
jgi:hypothetical protein